jgi:ribonuclease BN (tRNA processing enzyme)
MKLTVIGSGSTVPHSTRTSSGYWLDTSGGNMLLDCSASVPSRMAALGLDWPNLGAIWISHFHMDHVGGLGPLLAGTKHASQVKDREKPLRIFGPSGVRKLVAGFSDVNHYRLLDQPFAVEIVEIEAGETFEILPGIEAIAMKTPHAAESHAIRIRDVDGTSIVYSADTGYDEKLADFARDADLFVLECTYVKNRPAKKHLELAEAIDLINKAGPTRAMLTHFYPEWDDIDFQTEVAKFEPRCEMVQAADDLCIDIWNKLKTKN